MNIFPITPKLEQGDTKRLEKLGYLRSWNCLNAALKKHNPGVDDLKKLLDMEVGSTNPRAPIVEKLLVRVQKREREEIKQNIDTIMSTR